MITPHIFAKKGEIAKIVLMPGDPLRAKFIAETFLKNYKLVSSVRNVFMYTGEYHGKKISICASGMGQPSIGIYAFELFKFYDVEKIIRIGSAGAYIKELKLYDVVLADRTWSDSNVFAKKLLNSDDHWATPNIDLNNQILTIAKKLNITVKKVNAHTSDVFYGETEFEKLVKTHNLSCVEMESYALFIVAKSLNKKAACLLTISDNLVTQEQTTSEERQTAFKEMMKIALEIE